MLPFLLLKLTLNFTEENPEGKIFIKNLQLLQIQNSVFQLIQAFFSFFFFFNNKINFPEAHKRDKQIVRYANTAWEEVV